MPHSDGEPHPSFHVPTNNSGHGNVLKVGRGLSVYVDLQPPYTWIQHQHPTAQIVMALDSLESLMAWLIDGRLHKEECTVPHVWFVPPNTPHSAEWRRNPAAMLVFYPEREFVCEECGHELTQATVLRLAPLAQQDYMIGRFCHKFRELCHRRDSMSEAMIFAGATLLSSAILRACQKKFEAKGPDKNGLSEKRLEVVLGHIDLHPGQELSPAVLAALVGLSEDHFGRMFRRSTGRPTMKYVWRCRLHCARRLLEAGEKVASVAAELGFCDQSHLDRKFREEFGCSPGSVAPNRNRP